MPESIDDLKDRLLRENEELRRLFQAAFETVCPRLPIGDAEKMLEEIKAQVAEDRRKIDALFEIKEVVDGLLREMNDLEGALIRLRVAIT